MIWIALEILYRIQYEPKFQKQLCEESFPENRSTEISSPRGVWQKYFIWKSKKFWAKWGVAQFSTMFRCKVISTRKTEKNMFLADFSRFFDKLCNFLSFLMLITLERNIVESWATPHFAQNFLLFQITILKNIFVKLLKTSIFRWNGLLENSLHKVSFEILAHIVFDREFQGLSKSLFRFNLAIRLCWKISKIKAGGL